MTAAATMYREMGMNFYLEKVKAGWARHSQSSIEQRSIRARSRGGRPRGR
jgi:hypothetical protein